MSEYDYKQLDDIIHSRIRLAVMAILYSTEQAHFTYLRDKINVTDGNLSVQLRKLDEAKYISTNKSFSHRKPVSSYRMTKKGRKAFEQYLKFLGKILKA